MKSNCRWTQLMDEDFLLNHEDGEDAVFRKSKKCFLREENTLIKVGILGLEPRMTGPESVVLPLHHIPILKVQLLNCAAKLLFIFEITIRKDSFFLKK